MNDTFDMAALTADLSLDEGRRAQAYVDTRGFSTIGVGRNLSAKGVSGDEIDLMLRNDIAECVAALDSHVLWWRALPAGKQRVMLNLCFNLGWGGLSGFRKFLAAMQAHDWQTAANELMSSQWWRQVGQRGPRVVARLLTADPR